MMDLILAQHLWHERDRRLTLRAERERLIRDGRPPAPSASHRLRAIGGATLISLGYWLQPRDARSSDQALSPMSNWTATAPSRDMDVNAPYTFIYYSQMTPAGVGRSGGLMLLSLTWLPMQPTTVHP